jgi:D-lactate dehydrogenase (cytochrome)
MSRHRIRARVPKTDTTPIIERDADIVHGFLEDAAHVPGGYAGGIAFPTTEGQVAALLRAGDRVLPIGAQSSLTGGATPRGELLLSTRALTRIATVEGDRVAIGAGVPLRDLQGMLARQGRFYPPVPTYDGAFIGGTIATNAAGAATFKYGTTRRWIEALTVVLADGSVLDVPRGVTFAHADHLFEIERPDGSVVCVPVPMYSMPPVPKHSAGYHAAPGMDLIDLFIGSEGTLAVIIGATLRVIVRPSMAIALVPCASDEQALLVTRALRESAKTDLAGVEYIDARSLALLGSDTFTRAGLDALRRDRPVLMVQFEGAVDAFSGALESAQVSTDVQIAMPGDVRGATRLFEFREAVPATVNQRVAAAKVREHPDIEKTAADMIVPFDRLEESLTIYREEFERRNLDYAIWGHFSDGNLHPNVIPRSLQDVIVGKDVILEIGRRIVALGGSPLAEHGVGRSPIKQTLLRQLYGDEGIEQMRAVKRALDPTSRLAPGVIFPV